MCYGYPISVGLLLALFVPVASIVIIIKIHCDLFKAKVFESWQDALFVDLIIILCFWGIYDFFSMIMTGLQKAAS